MQVEHFFMNLDQMLWICEKSYQAYSKVFALKENCSKKISTTSIYLQKNCVPRASPEKSLSTKKKSKVGAAFQLVLE
jgi:hypothetical protein